MSIQLMNHAKLLQIFQVVDLYVLALGSDQYAIVTELFKVVYTCIGM